MSEINLFEVASRKKFRFETRRGEVTVEQLWEVPMTGIDSIDTIAIKLNSDLQQSSVKSFVHDSTPADTETTQKLELVKYVIAVRKAEAKARTEKAEKAAERKQLREAIAEQKKKELLSGSVEDLEKRLAALDEE